MFEKASILKNPSIPQSARVASRAQALLCSPTRGLMPHQKGNHGDRFLTPNIVPTTRDMVYKKG